MLGQGPVAGVDQRVFALTTDQVNAALHVPVELILGPGSVDPRDTPAVRCFGPEEDHGSPPSLQSGRLGQRPAHQPMKTFTFSGPLALLTLAAV